MNTDPRTPSSFSLAHDHFREPPKQSSFPELATADGGPQLNGAPRPRLQARQVMQGMRGATDAVVATTRKVAGGTHNLAAQSLRLCGTAAQAVARLLMPKPKARSTVERSYYTCLPDRLTSLAGLSREQYNLVRSSLPDRQIHQAGSTLMEEGELMPRPTLILKGWACRTRVHAGKLHVLGLLLPGDGINLFGPPGAITSTAISALTTVETVNAQPVVNLVLDAGDNSALRVSMHRVAGEEEEFLLNQTLRATMKHPAMRLAHLLAELHFRLARIGLATENGMPFPLDRHMVGAMLGLPPSIVLRAVRSLESRRLARFGHNRVLIPNDERLRKYASFTPPAFHDGPSRQLINDVVEDEDLVLTQPWMGAPSPSQSVQLERRPA